MTPTIPDGCIVVVDTGQNDRSKLLDQIVVVHSKHQGLVVSRLRDIDDIVVLVPEDGQVTRHVVFDTEWTVVGRVLWWIVQDEASRRTIQVAGKGVSKA